jgi:hypothetical protein
MHKKARKEEEKRNLMAQGMKVEVEFHSTHHQSKKHQINVHKIYAQSKVKRRNHPEKKSLM